ncbi:MAG: hypothetical protein A3K77_00525 [Euryarchaeota archaeon RBG_13_31_8]|nr:MAG: hypothetical protein A3K77_00525 [Euryarchaeota archaeon RBG_13_31_8]
MLGGILNNTSAGATTCTIQTKTLDKASSAKGVVTETWADTYTSVKCTLQEITGKLDRTRLGAFQDETHVLFLEYSNTILAGYRVVVSSITYFVTNVKILGQHHKMAFLKLMSGV